MRELTEKEWVKVDNLVDKLECSIDEAVDILDADKAIDRNQKVDFDLSPEEHKQAMKLANVKEHTVKKSNVYRPRKPNEIKGAIIAGLSKYLTETADFEVIDEEVTNKERTIMFTSGGNRYELTLIQKEHQKLKENAGKCKFFQHFCII